ncbi:phage tail assembly chaperone [Aurantiacibacter luteus]|uniref:Phage tail assembly chaperone n=1 Tax=Aurantiacibacter luteus TaxID=1581420 RepID=A0A0G9MUR3_9SPHN|nr:phage tail assembly chaperone [Aurantiacibacter luteus]KLE34461.1 hypothetical protein AAW00_09575 [Aurantiacibacter luteus]
MSGAFAHGARRLAGLAGRLLGWPPHWFWQATPAELAAILHEDTGTASPGMDRAALDRLMAQDATEGALEGKDNGR